MLLSWCFSAGKSTKRKMKVNNDKAFEWKRVWVIVRSFKVYSFLSSFKKLVILIESKRMGGIFERFKMKKGRNWAFERGKTDRWTLGQMMQGEQLRLRGEKRHVAYIQNQSHTLVIRTTWKQMKQERRRQWPMLIHFPLLKCSDILNHLFLHSSFQWRRVLPKDAATKSMFVCRPSILSKFSAL